MKKPVLSRLTARSQTIIPRVIREKLGVGPGDRLRYIETDEGIVIEKAHLVQDDPFVTFAEWSSEADEKAYADL